MLVRRVVKTTLLCGLSLIVGKAISEQKHQNNVKKILSANYMDDHTKVELMQDLNGIKVDHRVEAKKSNKEKLQSKITNAKEKSLILAKNAAGHFVRKIIK